MLEEKGKKLSGGQKQRITIARGLIKNAKVYVFDDITSSLDSLTEYDLIQSLKTKFKNKTILLISQKIKHIKEADKIIVLKEGTIICSGLHEELINHCNYYKKIVQSQNIILDMKEKNYGLLNIKNNYCQQIFKKNLFISKNSNDSNIKTSLKNGKIININIPHKNINFFLTLNKIAKLSNYKLFYLCLSLILSIAISLCNIYIPYLFGIVIDLLSNGLSKQCISFKNIFYYLILLLCSYLVSPIISYVKECIMIVLTQKLVNDLRVKIEYKITYIKIHYLDSISPGTILNLILNDVEIIGFTIQKTLSQFFTIFITLIGTFFMMLYMNIYMALICFLIIPLIFLLINPISYKSRYYFKNQQLKMDELNIVIEEYLSGYLVIKSFNLDNIYFDLFEKINFQLYIESKKASFYSSIILPILFFINTINYAIYCIVGGFFVLKNWITIGEVHVYTTYSRHFSYPLLQMSGILSTLQSTIASSERILNFLELEDEKYSDFKVKLQNPKGKILFKNITFGYSKNKIVINNFSLEIKSGQTVALIGPTGSGKTTIINLLLQFYEIDKGEIFIDDINIKDIDKKELRKMFGIVLQENLLFNGTIKENISYGNNEISNEELKKVTKIIGIDKYIESLPLKYETIIDESSSNISYGQKQLISIARAILINPSILLFDEATSSIDTLTETKITESIKYLINCRTSIIIAHRLSTIKNADLIVVINEGSILEKGTHQELLNKKGYYYRLYY